MWTQTNERFLDRGGCGDEFYLDARQRASVALAGLHGSEPDFEDLDILDDLDDAADDAAAH